MESVSKNKWKVRGAVLMIFLLGFVAGGLSLNAYHAWSLSKRDSNRQAKFEKMLNRLQLTEEQRNQVREILVNTREQLQALRKDSEPKVEEIRRQTDERLQKILTPEQWQKFQQLRDESRSKGKHDKGNLE